MFGDFVSSRSYMSEESKSLLYRLGRRKKVKKNEFLLREGQYCHQIYFVESGLVRTWFNKEGREINLNFVPENNFVTNLKSIRDQTPSENNISALESSVVLDFEKMELLNLYECSKEIALFGRNLLEGLLQAQEEHTNLFKLHTPAERYRHFGANNPQLLQRITLTQLSSYLGISRETLSRIRRS